MDQDSESPAGGVDEGLRGRAIEAFLLTLQGRGRRPYVSGGRSRIEMHIDRLSDDLTPAIDAVLTVLATYGGLRDALRTAVAEYHVGIRAAQSRDPLGAAKAILAGANLADDIDALLDQPTDRPAGDA